MMVHWQPGVTLADIEKQVILAALQYHNQNRTHAALSLGITTRTIQNKLNEYRGTNEELPEESEPVVPEQAMSHAEQPKRRGRPPLQK